MYISVLKSQRRKPGLFRGSWSLSQFLKKYKKPELDLSNPFIREPEPIKPLKRLPGVRSRGARPFKRETEPIKKTYKNASRSLAGTGIF